jgi:hypothetical protein
MNHGKGAALVPPTQTTKTDANLGYRSLAKMYVISGGTRCKVASGLEF